MSPSTALILHPTAATPRPVTTIHPQSAEIERHGVTIGEYDIHLQFGSILIQTDGTDDDYVHHCAASRHPQRSPEQINPGMIAEDAIARAYRLVRRLSSDNPQVAEILLEIRFRLIIANPFADRRFEP